MAIPILSLLTYLPMLGIGLICLIPANLKLICRWVVFLTLFLQGCCLSFILFFSPSNLSLVGMWGPIQWVERWVWIEIGEGLLKSFSIHYFLGIDALNKGLLILALIVLAIGLGAAWELKRRVKAYWMLYLLLNTLIIGSLLALDFFLFYIFFELTLLPTYFLIGLWGGEAGPKAATKFFLYAFAGTLLILFMGIAGGLGDCSATLESAEKVIPSSFKQVQPPHATKVLEKTPLRDQETSIYLQPTHGFRFLVLIGLVIGFLLKLGAVPFHSWLPDAHVAAPTGISVILAGILLKLAGYGLLRVGYSLFPLEALGVSKWIGILGLVGSLYASLNALAMNDLKRMVAYSSIAHMGIFLIGISSMTLVGFQSGIYQLISHGLISMLLFLIVEVLYSRTGSRQISDYRGLNVVLPYYTVVAIFAFGAAMGFPGFASFIVELLALLGIFASPLYTGWVGIIVGMGMGLVLLITVGYCTWTVQRLFGGPFKVASSSWIVLLYDLNRREKLLIFLLLAIIILLGIFPNWFLGSLEEGLLTFLEKTKR